MYTDGDISDIFAQCREHYNSAAIDEGGGGGAGDEQEDENDENSKESQQQRGRRSGDGNSSLSSIERSIGTNGASSGGYEASSSSSSSQTPNIANGRSGSKSRRFEHHVKKTSADQHIHTHTHKDRRRSSGSLEAALADVLAPAQGSAAPPTKCVSFTGTVKPPSSYNNRKHLRDRADHNENEPACKASELDSMERAARKSDPNDDDTSKVPEPEPESERHMMKREQALAQHQLLQGNEVTIEQAMTLCRQPRILTLSSEPFVVVHVNASFTKLSGLDAHIITGMPVETVFFCYSQPSASASGKTGCNGNKGNNGNDAESSSSASSNTAVISNWITKSDLCNDRVVDIIVRERFGNDVGGSRDEDMLSSRFQGTRRCRLMISKVCSFERSSSSSSSGSSTGGCGGSGGSGFSSREASNAELSSGEDAGIPPDSTSASEDMVLDNGGEPPQQKTTTHYLLQLHPCQLLVGPHAASKSTAGRTDKSQGKRRGGSGGGDETMYVIG